jgi:hypothetical protein
MLLQIQPRELEEQFWSSDSFQKAATEVDNLRFFNRIGSSMLYLCRCYKKLPEEVVGAIRRNTVNSTVIALLHMAWKSVSVKQYMEARWFMVLHIRSCPPPTSK